MNHKDLKEHLSSGSPLTPTLKVAEYPPVNAQQIRFLEYVTKESRTDEKYFLIARNAIVFGKNILDQDTLRFLQRFSSNTLHHARS